MSDIDFDELDKAVNTLMGDVPRVEPSKTDDIKTLTISSTLADNAAPSFAKLDSTLAEVNRSPVASPEKPIAATPARSSTPPLAARRGGRFMDVVHPSSDMKTATQTVRPASRQGVTIAPASAPVAQLTDDSVDNTPMIDDSVAPDTTYAAMTSSDTTAGSQYDAAATIGNDASSADWPDPLDMSGYEPDTKPESESIAQNEQAAVTVAEPDETIQPHKEDTGLSSVDELEYEDTQPLTSPFITDAKVEKRPLGGAPAEEPSSAPVLGALATTDDEIMNATDPDDQLPATPGPVEVQLPPELQSDLMAIETDGDMSGGKLAERDQEPLAGSVDLAPVAVESKPAVATVQDDKALPVSAASVGPTSIPQQYHEAPSTSDESNGSIYDTDSYHQPLAHPAKTKSGWLWVIWILLLLIVGGGGAVALYFIGII